MKKKIVALCLIIALLAIALIGGTMAYFTDTKAQDNVFTVGNVKIQLTEPNWVEADGTDTYPGQVLPKDPTVENIGRNPCFLRIQVTGLYCLVTDNMITYETNDVAGDLGADWVLHTDGYYYYSKVLAAGATTSPLFEQIRIPVSVTNGFEGSYDVRITAQAVQAQGAKTDWADVQSMTVAEMAAWFSTCGIN